MSKTMHTRVISFTYFSEDLPTFESQEAMDSWFHAIGRMAMFGLQGPDVKEDTYQVVRATLSGNPTEFCAAYYKAMPATDVKDEAGYPVYYKGDQARIDSLLDELAGKSREHGRAFVMAAVQSGSDDKFNLHS